MAGKVGVPRNPRSMRFSADSRRLYVASEQEPMVSIIDVAERKLIQSVPTGGERAGGYRYLPGRRTHLRLAWALGGCACV
jgi:YVTN family beta-propeller protein